MIKNCIGKRYLTASNMVVKIESVVIYGGKCNVSYPLIRDYWNKKCVRMFCETYNSYMYILASEFQNDFKLYKEIK